ncbi:MAG: patatin-like phospholipase family protein [Pseudohongiellaceae bacterium]
MTSIFLYAGPVALNRIRSEGLHAHQFTVMAGASGGPKWFVLYGLDRYLFGDFFRAPVNGLATLGSSVGAWRLACLAQPDPVAAIDRLAELYSKENYSAHPTAGEITAKAKVMLQQVLTADGARNIVANKVFKSHIIAGRARGILAANSKALLATGLGLAAASNAVSRKLLSLYFERIVFNNHMHTCELTRLRDLPTRDVKLTVYNTFDALMASGSIPFVLDGVRDISGAGKGLYLDGGITDYHFDVPFHLQNGLVLYPHFQPKVVPGWFDKHLPRRKVKQGNFANVLMVVPSPEFVANLPYGKIPDRDDFRKLAYPERVRYWQTVLKESTRLADEFAQLVGSERVAEIVRPFDTTKDN